MASIASRPPPAVSPSAASTSVSALSAPTIPTSVESTQENDPLIVRFTNVQDLFDAINCTIGDFLTVINVSPSQFTEIEREREKRCRKFRFRRYDSKSRILIITILTRIHEALHLGLYRRYCNQLARNGTDEDWIDVGCATFRAEQGHPGGDGGEGDSTGGPWPEREGADKWPTLVIESGYSETLPELRKDMRWWFQASNHEVKIVILAKFDDQQHHILLEKWEEEAISSPQGAITRSRAAAMSQQNGVLNPVIRQSITITRDETTNPVSYNATRGPLVLGFRLLFLRNPGPQERDFVLSIQDLQLIDDPNIWSKTAALGSRLPRGVSFPSREGPTVGKDQWRNVSFQFAGDAPVKLDPVASSIDLSCAKSFESESFAAKLAVCAPKHMRGFVAFRGPSSGQLGSPGKTGGGADNHPH